MTVKDLIEILNENFKPDDEVCLSIKLDTDCYEEAYLAQVYRTPEDGYPVLSNEDDDGNWQ